MIETARAGCAEIGALLTDGPFVDMQTAYMPEQPPEAMLAGAAELETLAPSPPAI